MGVGLGGGGIERQEALRMKMPDAEIPEKSKWDVSVSTEMSRARSIKRIGHSMENMSG